MSSGRQPSRIQSIWESTGPLADPGPLTGHASADVCIVGAGIAGMSVAHQLARRGQSVIVLDDGPVGGGMTARTTAHLVNALDDRYFNLERYHGQESAALAAASHTAAIEQAAAIVNEGAIDCDFDRLDGYLFLPAGESIEILDRELEAVHRAGLGDVERVARAPIESFETGPCLRFPRQAQFHPLKFLAGLMRVIESHGGRICTRTHVTTIEGGSDARVETESGLVVRARAVVVATNTPVNDRYAIHTKQAPYTTYVIGLGVPRGAVNKALFWDTAQETGMHSEPVPYHYVRLVGGDQLDDVLIAGGEDHKTGQAEDLPERFLRLEAWVRERFPMAGDMRYQWSGQVMEPFDGLAFIGRNPADADNVYVATGDSGNGMTHGIIAGMLIGDLILGRNNPWVELYEPSRVRLRTAAHFVKENVNVVAQLRDYVTPGDVGEESDLAPGSGAVIRHGLKKIATYRDDAGALHEFSAVCPHLKCIVRWNGVEKTWDCPCHGSRFDALGHVLNGPAISDLEPIR